MPAFAIYRKPYESECHLAIQKEGQPEELPSVSALSGKKGFVMAPFALDIQHPVLLLHPDFNMTVLPDDLLRQYGSGDDNFVRMIDEILNQPQQKEPEKHCTHFHYAVDFANFHSHILEGDFSKIVLARCCVEQNKHHLSPLHLFAKACKMYPRLFVALVSAYKCGTWLMATPEVLLEGDGRQWSTMSLAGTMPLSGEQMDFDEPPSPHRHVEHEGIRWSIKNIQEQRFVSTYITEALEQMASDIEEKGPYTMRAGNLVHLRSDFHFTISNRDQLGELINILYPTPAVCGLPKDMARDFIVSNEFAPRCYYSGFLGSLNPDAETHLYVSLRCMRIDKDTCSLYAGGGLLADSDMETEWSETEMKMDTMRNLLA